jgi:hypothetical protein
MRNIKIIAKTLFTLFLAVNAYDAATIAWQKILVIVAALGLILFFMDDIRSSVKKDMGQ